MNMLCFIGSAVPLSLIVLISFHSIPGYSALSGLFNNDLFFSSKPVLGKALMMHLTALDRTVCPAT